MPRQVVIIHSITCRVVATKVENKSDSQQLTPHTLHTLTSDVWGVYCEYSGEMWPCQDSTALYEFYPSACMTTYPHTPDNHRTGCTWDTNRGWGIRRLCAGILNEGPTQSNILGCHIGTRIKGIDNKHMIRYPVGGDYLSMSHSASKSSISCVSCA